MDTETIAVVMGVVEALKRAGVTGRASFITAVALGFALFAAEQAAALWPAFEAVYRVLRSGLYGVAATGWYDLVSAQVRALTAPGRAHG